MLNVDVIASLFPDLSLPEIERQLACLTAEELAQLDAVIAEETRKRSVPPFPQWLEVVSPSMCWDWAHLRYIQAQLQRLEDGEIEKLAIFCPPRHGKSELVTVRFPAYWLEKYPDQRVIVGAYNATLAEKFSRKTRALVRERMTLSSERKSAGDWETPQGGGLRAVGVGVGVTGHGGNLIIIDDPVKSREEAESEAYRKRAWNWYKDDLYTRREPGARMVLIQTRWHHEDLAGQAMAEEKGEWTIINLPALAEDNDPLGRLPGQALCPERYDEKALADIRKLLKRSFLSLYQQRPTPEEGALIKLSWFGRYRVPLAHYLRIIQSWDTASKGKEIHDPWCCTTWGETEQGYHLLDVLNRPMDYPEGKRTVKSHFLRWNPSMVLIEDKSSGQALLQELKLETLTDGRKVPVKGMLPEKDKLTRMAVEADTIEAGLVFLPEEADWLSEYEQELVQFPESKHDGRVDSTSQFLRWITAKRQKMLTGFQAQGIAPAVPVVTIPASGPYEEVVLPTAPPRQSQRQTPLWTLQDLLKRQ